MSWWLAGWSWCPRSSRPTPWFPDKEALVDALFESMIETVETVTSDALREPDAWAALCVAMEKVCEIQAMDRGLREVMLGTGKGPQRQT